jgi:hypothetical protein
MVSGLYLHVAGIGGGVIYTPLGLRLHQANQLLQHFGRGIELTAFLTGAVREHPDQILLAIAQQVRVFKIFSCAGGNG